MRNERPGNGNAWILLACFPCWVSKAKFLSSHERFPVNQCGNAIQSGLPSSSSSPLLFSSPRFSSPSSPMLLSSALLYALFSSIIVFIHRLFFIFLLLHSILFFCINFSLLLFPHPLLYPFSFSFFFLVGLLSLSYSIFYFFYCFHSVFTKPLLFSVPFFGNCCNEPFGRHTLKSSTGLLTKC